MKLVLNDMNVCLEDAFMTPGTLCFEFVNFDGVLLSLEEVQEEFKSYGFASGVDLEETFTRLGKGLVAFKMTPALGERIEIISSDLTEETFMPVADITWASGEPPMLIYSIMIE